MPDPSPRPPARARGRRFERAARRALARELSGYATTAERDELLLLLTERDESGSAEIAAIVREQVRAELFRAG